MKAKRVNEKLEFQRGKDSKEAVDIGIQRTANPNNYANQSSYKIGVTNEEFLNGILNQLEAFHHDLSMDMAEWSESGKDYKYHPAQDRITTAFSYAEKDIEKIIRLLKSIKR